MLLSREWLYSFLLRFAELVLWSRSGCGHGAMGIKPPKKSYLFPTKESLKHHKIQVLVQLCCIGKSPGLTCFWTCHVKTSLFGPGKNAHVLEETNWVCLKTRVYQQKKLEVASLEEDLNPKRHTHTQLLKSNPKVFTLPFAPGFNSTIFPPGTQKYFSQLSTRQLVWHMKKVHSNSETTRALPLARTALWNVSNTFPKNQGLIYTLEDSLRAGTYKSPIWNGKNLPNLHDHVSC